MGGRQSSLVAPEPRAPPSSHSRPDGLTHARKASGDAVREGPRNLPKGRNVDAGTRSQLYSDAGCSLGEVQDDGRLMGLNNQARAQDELSTANARQLTILSEVSVIGQEFGWPQISPVSTSPTDVAAPAGGSGYAGTGHAAGVFGHDVCASVCSRHGGGQQPGRDTAIELRRFMHSSAGNHEIDDSGSKDGKEYLRSPALLQDWDASNGQGGKNTRPASARMYATGTRGRGVMSVEVELRREIAASRARTKLHMEP